MTSSPRSKLLIVNADDFGLSDGVNRGVIEAHRNGIVTSASLMVRQPAAKGATAMAAGYPALSLGLHLDIGEWRFESGEWFALYERASLNDAAALEAEVDAQIGLFQDLAGRPPTHVDAHQHAHRNEPLRTIVERRTRALGVPLRHCTGFRYLGDFYGQDDEGIPCPDHVEPDFLIGLIERLPEGVAELCCHPAETVDFAGVYAGDRVTELSTLTDQLVRKAIEREGVQLVSFADIAP